MPQHLTLSVTFLDPTFHGRRDGGEPEWPPSPLRLFQALVAAAAARWGEHESLTTPVSAFEWLERLAPPLIVAPPITVGSAYRLSVPNNAMDLVARAWARGNTSNQGDANPATHRALKTVRSTHLPDVPADATQTPESDQVHYCWELPDPIPQQTQATIDTLTASARSLVALGWGVDLVAAHARVLSDQQQADLPGERWLPTTGRAPTRLRTPRSGTLEELRTRHGRFLQRLAGDSFVPVPPLGAYREISYRRDCEPAERPCAAFQTLAADASRLRIFDPRTDRCAVRNVAAMTRHAVAQAAHDAGWLTDDVNSYVHGHDPASGDQARGGPDHPRFAYLPLPTIDPRGVVSSIARVMIAEPPGGTGERAAWLRRMLSGRDLVDTHSHRPQAVLSVIPGTDWVLNQYLGPEEGASEWSSVTPVILTGFDDGDAHKAERLIRKAIREAGFSLLSQTASVTWRNVGFRPGLEPSTRYQPPQRLEKLPRFHVLICWRDGAGRPVPVRGPVVIGAGRYQGFGLFAVRGTGMEQARR